ncbi:MAG: hypothetical protein P4N24_16755 [Acidobacteriota bacterium]|nr:hypothetical protein [Acidobacteriota bacterium]
MPKTGENRVPTISDFMTVVLSGKHQHNMVHQRPIKRGFNMLAVDT